ncbi:MAG: prepilin-type N-terminal cleavage/methylation domain-containing protein [Planctomycetes bacterium]|nr:prepilin-type N-terminal cleavage/methylation domain-containing protein [Planctomycetota bacterium]
MGRIAFSLIEMMIAIIILGFGLIMVATMFPVAWSRARTLGEYTVQSSLTEATDATVYLLLQVDGYRSDKIPLNAGSFAGDFVYFDGDSINPNGLILAFSDTRVHALHMENIRIQNTSNVRTFYPNRERPWQDRGPWELERTKMGLSKPELEDPGFSFFWNKAFGGPQMRWDARMYPPMRPRLKKTLDPSGAFSSEDPAWDDTLDTRRYGVAIFHKLRERPEWDPATKSVVADPRAAANRTRDFTMYYVTLRRGQPTYRFAQQDPLPARTPNPEARNLAVVPAALPPTEDLLFPVPWRVQVLILPSGLVPWRTLPPGKTLTTHPAPTGIPTEVQVNGATAPSAGFLVDMFSEGAQFIDEVSGQVFRVVRRQVTADPSDRNKDSAILTLDREIVGEDINDFDTNVDGVIDDNDGFDIDVDMELLRTVWVFPPPVQAARDRADRPVFDGNQPVVGIDIRSLTLSPRS